MSSSSDPTSTARRRTGSSGSTATPPATRSATSTCRPSLRGDFRDAHATGDQANVLPTDTQKNTSFAFAKEHGVTSPEDYALDPRPALPRRHPRRHRRRIEVEEYAWDRIAGRRRRPRPRVRQARRRGPHHRRDPTGPQRRGTDAPMGRLRRQGPRRPQVDRLGVQGLPQGRVHDPAGDRRPHPRHLARRPVALRAAPTASTGTSPSTTSGSCCSRRSRRRTAGPCRRRLYAMGGAVLARPPGGRRDQVLRAQQAPLPRRPVAVRAGEQRRGVHRRRPPLRPHRGHRPARRTAPTPATPGSPSRLLLSRDGDPMATTPTAHRRRPTPAPRTSGSRSAPPTPTASSTSSRCTAASSRHR